MMLAAFAGGWKIATDRAERREQVQLPPSSPAATPNVMVVTASPVLSRSVTRTVEAVGTLHGYEEVTLSANVEGRVTKIHHDLASRVKPGELLLELDPTEKQLAVDQAQRSVQAELARWGFTSVPNLGDDHSQLPSVVSAKSKFDLAQSIYQRMLALRASNSIAVEEVEKARSDSLVAQAEWKNQLLMAESAAATARLRQAELAIAEQKLRDTKIYAPLPTSVPSDADQHYSISQRLVSEGTLLRPGTEVLKIVLGQTLKLRLAVPENLGGQVAVGQHVEVLSSAHPQPATGMVARIGPAIDRTSRTYLVEVEVPNLDGRLKPGGFAKARIEVRAEDQATVVPLSGLVAFAGIYKIFLIEGDVAREFKVTLGEQAPDWVEIASPRLPAGSQVVTSGQRLLSDGMQVVLRESATESTAKSEARP